MFAGHGCPNFRNNSYRKCEAVWTRLFCVWTSLVLLCLGVGAAVCSNEALAQSESSSPSVNHELRIVWGGPQLRNYSGTISVEAGTITSLRNLSLQEGSIGSVSNIDHNEIELKGTVASQFGGVDVRVSASRSSALTFRFEADGEKPAYEATVALDELMQDKWIQGIDDSGAKLAIERQVHDKLRVMPARESWILKPSEPVAISLKGVETGLPAGEYQVLATWVPNSIELLSQAKPIQLAAPQKVRVDSSGGFDSLPLSLSAPESHGSWLLELKVESVGFLPSLVSSRSSLTRRIDAFVFDDQFILPSIVGWKEVGRIQAVDTLQPSGFAWLSSVVPERSLSKLSDRIKNRVPLPLPLQIIAHGSISQRAYQTAEVEQGNSLNRWQFVSTTEKGAVECLVLGEKSWISLPLSHLQPNVPHRVTVRMPDDRPMELAMSVRSPNAQGVLPPISQDTRCKVGSRRCENSGLLKEHQMTFWVNDSQSQLLLLNPSGDSSASIWDISIEQAEQTQLKQNAGLPIDSSRVEATDSKRERQVGVYLSQPLLTEYFNSQRSLDALSGQTLDSWSNLDSAVRRLIQSMEWHNCNTAVLPIFIHGGAIFPSDRLEPSRRYDNGVFHADGRSTDIKDCVELLLRYFDSRGLTLIVTLDIDSKLPKLKDLPGESAYQQPIDMNQLEETPQYRVKYNPLHRQVQAELVKVIGEVAARYKGHPSFGGVSLRLTPNSHAVFAGDRWGYDTQSLESFQKDRQGSLPVANLQQVFAAPTLRYPYLAWRAGKLTKLYSEMAAEIKRHAPAAKLYLNTLPLIQERPSSNDFYDPISIVRNPTEFLLAFGIDVEALVENAGIVLVQGVYQEADASVVSQDWVRLAASDRGLASLLDHGAASVIVQEPSAVEVPEIDKIGNASAYPSTKWLYGYPVDCGNVEAALSSQLYYSDNGMIACGGWSPFAAMNKQTREVFQTLRSIPASGYTDVGYSNECTNVRVRQYAHAGKTIVTFINRAPWTEEFRLKLDPTVVAYRIDADRRDPISMEQDQALVKLPPLSLVAIELDREFLEPVSAERKLNAELSDRLNSELMAMETVVAQAADPTLYSSLADLGGNFEQWESNAKPVRWNVTSLPNVFISRSDDLPHSGTSSICIENRNVGEVAAWIQSKAFQPPATGRMAFNAWLRTATLGPTPTVRLSVTGRLRDGSRFERSELFGASHGDHRTIANDWGRRPATLYVGDVPSDEILELQVAIDLIGPGKIWIDDIEVNELQLHPDERIYLAGQLLVAKQKLSEGNPYPAEQLLDSCWSKYLRSFRATVSQEPTERPTAEHEKATEDWNHQRPILQGWRDSVRSKWKR